jgi:hypothetical protein
MIATKPQLPSELYNSLRCFDLIFQRSTPTDLRRRKCAGRRLSDGVRQEGERAATGPPLLIHGVGCQNNCDSSVRAGTATGSRRVKASTGT